MGCVELKSLKLQGSKVTAEEAQKVQKALPGCKVEM